MWGPTLRMSWRAWNPHFAAQACLDLEDQLAGAQLEPWVLGWEVQWVTWVDHCTYGVLLWCQPHSEKP